MTKLFNEYFFTRHQTGRTQKAHPHIKTSTQNHQNDIKLRLTLSDTMVNTCMIIMLLTEAIKL